MLACDIPGGMMGLFKGFLKNKYPQGHFTSVFIQFSYNVEQINDVDHIKKRKEINFLWILFCFFPQI